MICISTETYYVVAWNVLFSFSIVINVLITTITDDYFDYLICENHVF
jgi:hypothetical protein